MYRSVGDFSVYLRPIEQVLVHYHISNAMQYSNTALETTTLVMYDPNTFFYVVPLDLSYGSANFIKIHNVS